MRTIFYARVSDDSYETNTIDNQISIIKHYYNKKIKCNLSRVSIEIEKVMEYRGNLDENIELDRDIEIVEDKGYSATDMNRPGIKYILDKVEKSEIKMIVAKDISRISRNYIELGLFIKQCMVKGVKLITVIEGDYIKEQDYFMKDMKGLLADMYSKDISIKVKSALDVRKAEGIYAFPLLPFGYTKVEGKIVIDREESVVVRYIFDIFEKEKSVSSVKKKLDREGIFTPSEYNYIKKELGDDIKWLSEYKKMSDVHKAYVWHDLHIKKKLWSYSTIKKILTNEFYIGTMVYNKTVRENWRSKRREKSGLEKKIYNHHEAIIGRDSFMKIQLYNTIRNNRK